jgi:ubiquinone/menaquinone biosynthesis C-methylase UbiE
MGIYGRHIFPRLMDWVMSGDEFHRLRAELLQAVRGEVLEIGLGTGLNLSHYPSHISHLSAIDPAIIIPRKVRARIAAVSFPVETMHMTAENLPYPDRRFDTIVSTWTLCTIPDPVQALREVARVLRPAGRFLFLEHGRSDDPRVATWQDRLNPIQNLVGCGCNLNRRIDRLIEQGGLKIIELDRFQMNDVPRIGGTMYRGSGIRAD